MERRTETCDAQLLATEIASRVMELRQVFDELQEALADGELMMAIAQTIALEVLVRDLRSCLDKRPKSCEARPRRAA